MARKKIFDKKTSIRFKVVDRSQRDPLIADERAPQHVLIADNNDRRDQQIKYGIYFDDDYNYLQHLRDVKSVHTSDTQGITHGITPSVDSSDETSQDSRQQTQISNPLLLPSSLFASTVEEDVGMLGKSALPIGPQPDWDPDVVAAMDDDFDYDDPNNQIDDDFIAQADVNDVNDDSEWQDMSDGEDGDEDESTLSGDESEHLFDDEETKSHFTNYSLTSSVMRRNEGLTTLDQRFETLYEKEYSNDCDIGALDLDSIEGSINANDNQLMSRLINEFEKHKLNKEVYESDAIDKSLLNCEKFGEELTELEINESDKKDRFDCESILSTYSSLYNHPKLIRVDNNHKQRVKLSVKTGIPIGVIDKNCLTAKKLAKLDALNNISDRSTKSVRSVNTRLSSLSQRSSFETPEERRLRKLALKEYRRERRLEKKLNKLTFNSERIKQDKQIINLQNNLKGVKLA